MLNSTAAVILEDVIRGAAKRQPSEKQANYILKGTIAVLGVVALLLVFVVEKLGGVLAVSPTSDPSATSPCKA